MSMRRRNLRVRPVQSLKHVVDTNGGITGGTASVNDVVNTVESPVSSVANNVANGSTIHGIYLRVEVIQKVAAGGVDNIYMLVYKNPGNNVANPPVDSVGTADTRRFVVHQEMLMTGTVLTAASAIPKTLFKGFIAFPRSYKRNGYDDKWQVVIGHRSAEATQQSNFCLQCIYKEFR